MQDCSNCWLMPCSCVWFRREVVDFCTEVDVFRLSVRRWRIARVQTRQTRYEPSLRLLPDDWSVSDERPLNGKMRIASMIAGVRCGGWKLELSKR